MVPGMAIVSSFQSPSNENGAAYSYGTQFHRSVLSGALGVVSSSSWFFFSGAKGSGEGGLVGGRRTCKGRGNGDIPCYSEVTMFNRTGRLFSKPCIFVCVYLIRMNKTWFHTIPTSEPRELGLKVCFPIIFIGQRKGSRKFANFSASNNQSPELRKSRVWPQGTEEPQSFSVTWDRIQ